MTQKALCSFKNLFSKKLSAAKLVPTSDEITQIGFFSGLNKLQHEMLS